MRDVSLVQVSLNYNIRRGPNRTENAQYLFRFNEPSGLLEGLRRHVTVIKRNQFDLALVHASLIIQLLEVSGLGFVLHGCCRHWSAVRACLPDDNFIILNARTVFLVLSLRLNAQRSRDNDCQTNGPIEICQIAARPAPTHCILPRTSSQGPNSAR